MTTAKKRVLITVVCIIALISIWIALGGFIPIKIDHNLTGQIYARTENGWEYFGQTNVNIFGERWIQPFRDDVFYGSFEICDQTIETFQISSDYEILYYMNGSKKMLFGEILTFSLDLSSFAVDTFKVTWADANTTHYKSDKLVLCGITLDEYLKEREEQLSQ